MHRQTRILIGLLLTMTLRTFSQSPIFVTIAGGDLYKLNLSTCTSTYVGATGQGFGDIAFTPNGKLWGIVTGNLYQIDTTNANATLIGYTGLQGVSLVGLNDTTLLIEVGQILYGIRTTNTSTYSIGNLGYQASGDFSWYDNKLYMHSGGQLIKITLNPTNTSVLSSVPVNSTVNPIPTCEGVVTGSFVASDNLLIGFSFNNVLKICQIDGTYQTLCSGIVPGGIPGGASIRLPVQNPEPTSCLGISSVKEFTKHETNITISPNPFSNETTITADRTLTNANLIIYNSLGQIVKQIEVNGQSIKFLRDNFTSGLYFIQIKENSKTVSLDKLVVADN